MNQLNNRINLDRAVGAGDNASKEETTMRNSSKKTPWHLRFAPGAILRKKAIIAIIAVVAVLTPISAIAVHPVVASLYGWGAGQTLNAAQKAIINKWLTVKKATASVNGAYWVSNRYSYYARAGSDTSLSDFDAPDSWRRVVVSQGHELDDDPVGTGDGQAMETELAERYLEKQGRYNIVRRHGVLVNDDDETVLVMNMRARADSIAAYMRKVRATIRELHDDDSFNWKPSLMVRYSTYRHVGNHKMVSEYDDPNVPKVPELAARVRGSGSEVNTYTGTIEWTKWDVNSSGNLVDEKVRKLPVDNFLSWKTSKRTRQLCFANQVIKDPHISAGIARQIEKRSESYRSVVTDGFGRKRRLWKKRYKIVVAHVKESDLYGD